MAGFRRGHGARAPRGAPHRHAAFGAIKATLPLDSTAYEPQRTAQDGYFIWVERIWLNKLEALRQPGEGRSETILRLVAMEAGGRPGRRGAELFGRKPALRPNGRKGAGRRRSRAARLSMQLLPGTRKSDIQHLVAPAALHRDAFGPLRKEIVAIDECKREIE